jgi:putative phosphoesterase
MSLLFISDIHGSINYLKKILEIYEKEKAGYIAILGDILYHGARNMLPFEYNPKEVALLLNKYADKIIAVRGNCDSEVDAMVLDFPIMADYSTILCGGRRLFLTHGHIYNERNLPKLGPGDVFLHGHTHIPKAEKKENTFIINPGSITFPKEGNPNTYGILEGDTFKIKELDGNVFKEIALYRGRE